jgi:CheY-like chemotaxis protein/two-component sensor histidine kinase
MLAIRDISDVIALERLQIENKSKTMMINSISHELRTPLNCISLVVDEVIPKVSNELAEKLKSCKSCIKLLTFQLNDMMDYSEILAGSFFPHLSQVNVRKMLRNSLELIKIPAEYKKLAVSCKISDNVPDRIEIDGYRVQKVVINLLTNALKYTLKGKLQLSAKLRRGSLKIKVKDTGIGIPEKRLSEICELFTDSANSALSGLGLHICKEILKTFDSKLKVKSSEGRGSSFSFCVDLKRTDLKALDDVQKEFSKGFSMKSGEFPQFEDFPCILVVDDTDFSRMCVVNLLKNEGVSVFEACNGQEAVDFVVNYDKVGIQLKCIIMDINMPVMDGWKAARLLKKLFLQGSLSYFPSIIGYTAFSQQGDINKCYESGMISYLNKPTSKQELVSSIKKYI